MTLAAVIGTVSLVLYTSSSKQSMGYSSLLEASNKDTINFTFKKDDYDAVPYFNRNADSLFTYKFLEVYDGIIEPHSEMKFHLYEDNENYYEFSVCPTGSSKANCQSGAYYKTSEGQKYSSSVKFECSPYDTFDLSVAEYDSDKNLVQQHIGSAVCLYVRRELRALSDSDREALIVASAEIYNLDDEKGQAKYGENFKSSSYMLKFHHFNAGLRDQDHVHEGNGFLTQHLKMTNMFEDALKAVNPAVSLAYWDFTIDNSLNKTAANSYPMSPDMFGSMTFPKNMMSGFRYDSDKVLDAKISDSLFANLPAEKSDNTVFPGNGFGYMRAPWNMNPSPYISRFTFDFNHKILLPTCEMHYDILQYDDMMDFFFKVAFGPHATVHTLTGGFYGCDKFQPLVDAGYIKSTDNANEICSLWLFYLKEFWRYGYITPRSGCVADPEKLEEAKCGFDCTEGLESKILTRLLMQAGGKMNLNAEGLSDAWLDFICNGGDGGSVYSGDHLESASPADPSFWVIHPTLERLLQAKFMAGGFKSEVWATDERKDYVCDKPMCYDEATGVRDYYETCCYGHYEGDRLLDGVTGDRNNYVGDTNGELVAATDPRSTSYSVSYVYDSFTWSHCKEDFAGLFTSMATEMDASSTAVSNKIDPKPRGASQLETRRSKTVRKVMNLA